MKRLIWFSLIFFFSFIYAQNGISNPIHIPSIDKKIIVETWIENLKIPWSLVFLPDERALVSERPGIIKLIRNGKLQSKPYAIIDVSHIGEGGLMGLAVHPDFPQNPYIYAMHTYKKGVLTYNRVIRIRDYGDYGKFDKVIIDNIPGGRLHNGGRIAFGPDKMLYITTGEIFDAELAQNLKSLAGKILRITSEGEIPIDNPFKNSPIYSYGHRNPQGIAWHPETKDLFSSEHGPSGEYLRFANDEINIIKKGGNYGWPEIIGRANKQSFINPFILFEKTTPPSGMTFYNSDKIPELKGDLFIATLRSKSLLRIKLKIEKNDYKVVFLERWFEDKYGRLRDVVQGPDGYIYFLTNNRDGRGSLKAGDDKILRISILKTFK